MKKVILAILVLSILLVGCAKQEAPDPHCTLPYILVDGACCQDADMDKKCDPEVSDDGFAEPEYKGEPLAKDIADVTSPDYEPEYQDPVTVVTQEYVGTKDEVKKLPSPYDKPKYTTPEPSPGWSDSNEYMTMTVKKVTIDKVKVEPKNLRDPDTKYFIKEMVLEIDNPVNYETKLNTYVHPIIFIYIADNFDFYVRETLLCDQSDDLDVTGCKTALPEGEAMTVTIGFDDDYEIRRPDTPKMFRVTLENKRDDRSAAKLKIEETVDFTKEPDFVYT